MWGVLACVHTEPGQWEGGLPIDTRCVYPPCVHVVYIRKIVVVKFTFVEVLNVLCFGSCIHLLNWISVHWQTIALASLTTMGEGLIRFCSQQPGASET